MTPEAKLAKIFVWSSIGAVFRNISPFLQQRKPEHSGTTLNVHRSSKQFGSGAQNCMVRDNDAPAHD
jgi:hypothetical protein